MTFELQRFSNCAMTPDSARGKAFFACQEQIGSTTSLAIHSFDLATGTRGATVLLSTFSSSSDADFPVRIVRWGNDGLAVATVNLFRGGGVYLHNGPFVN
jgi:hypothetical protein